MVADVSSLAAQVRRQEEQVARSEEAAHRKDALIDACAFQLSNDIGDAVVAAVREFNRAVESFPGRQINTYTTGSSPIVSLGKSRSYPKVYVSVSLNLTTQRLEVNANRITKLGSEDLRPMTFLLEVVEDCVEVHDNQGYVAPHELAAKLMQYFL